MCADVGQIALLAERGAIGAALVHQDGVQALLSTPPEAFGDPSARLARDAAEVLVSRGAPVDVVSLVVESKTPALAGWLAESVASTPSGNAGAHYCGIVRDQWRRRRIQRALETGAAQLASADTAGSALEHALLELDAAGQDSQDGHGPQSPVECAERALRLAETRADRTERPASSGIDALDELLAVHAGHLVVIAGRPGMGKTALALQWAAHVADLGGRCLVFSLEMGREELFCRLACSRAGVQVMAAMRGELPGERLAEYSVALRELSERQIWVDDSPGLSLPLIANRARRFSKAKGKTDLVIVDYLQLLDTPGKSADREKQLAQISRGFKRLARELAAPVLLLSQLNRACDGRADKRPMLSDLRETGAIEQDADSVVMAFRPAVYGDTGDDELIVRKQRHGSLGTAIVRYEGAYVRFGDVRNRGTRHAASGGDW